MMDSVSQDPLNTLHAVINDVLVQTGHALRASSRRDAQGNLLQGTPAASSRLPESVRTFHSALDELERDIINAKSVLLRDLEQLQARRLPVDQAQLPTTSQQPSQQQPSQQPPKEVEPQTRSPMVIDVESSSPAADDGKASTANGLSKGMAPFPDMGMPEGVHQDVAMKDEAPTGPASRTEEDSSAAASAPTAAMELLPNNGEAQGQTLNGSSDIPDPELNFTDMEFSVAPANADSQDQPSAPQETSFDFATFAPADGGNDLLSLLPQGSNDHNTAGSQAPPASDSPANPEEKKVQAADPNYNNMFALDDNDGMDFDFSLDSAAGEFNDLMDDRDGTVDMTATDDFDTSLFFDKPDET